MSCNGFAAGTRRGVEKERAPIQPTAKCVLVGTMEMGRVRICRLGSRAWPLRRGIIVALSVDRQVTQAGPALKTNLGRMTTTMSRMKIPRVEKMTQSKASAMISWKTT